MTYDRQHTSISGLNLDPACALCYMTSMARGDSGRIVVEIDPALKGALYVELARQGLTLKAWFTKQADRLVANGAQSQLFAAEPPARAYESEASGPDKAAANKEQR
jgi:hypothetical protein